MRLHFQLATGGAVRELMNSMLSGMSMVPRRMLAPFRNKVAKLITNLVEDSDRISVEQLDSLNSITQRFLSCDIPPLSKTQVMSQNMFSEALSDFGAKVRAKMQMMFVCIHVHLCV